MKKYFLLIFFLGFLVYFQSLFNSFVWDDIQGQILNNDILYGFNNIPEIIFYHWSPYYKPLFFIFLNIIVTLFGENPFPFHLVALLIHISNSFLIFLLFSKFFRKNLSLILSLIFLVHPLISEAVFYASALQDVLYPFFGLIALNILTLSGSFKYKSSIILLFLMLSLFSKETGIAFMALAVLYKYFFNKNYFKEFLFALVGLFSLYAILRFGILRISFLNPEFQSIWTMDADIKTRLFTIPQIIYKYFTLAFFPEKLQIFQLWWVRDVTFSSFYFPLIVLSILFGIIILLGIYSYHRFKKESYPYFFFLAFLFLGLLLHLQIIPLDMTFAERWGYLFLIGLLGTIGFLINKLEITNRKLKAFYLISVIFILLLSVRTFVRSFDWRDNKTLILHDYQVNKHNPGIYYLVGTVYADEGRYEEAIKIMSQLKKISANDENVNNALAFIEITRENYEKAEEIFDKSEKKSIKTKINYGYLLLKTNPKKGEAFLKESLKEFPDSYDLNMLMVLTEDRLENESEALRYLEKARTLNYANRDRYKQIYEGIINDSLNIKYSN